MSLNSKSPTQKFAYALASKLPVQPANNRSTFNVHNSFGNYRLNLTLGQNANFDALMAKNLITDSTPVPSTSVSVRPSTISARVTSTAIPVPTSTGIPSSCVDTPELAFPVNVAPGWKVAKVAGGLVQPRGVIIDTDGNLLVVENGLGITAHKIGSDGCLTAGKTVISQKNLNHGIILSHNGNTLYASSATSVFAWSYNATTMSVSENLTTIVTGMDSSGHVTRTLIIPPKHPDLLLVSHGSNDNFDYGAADILTGRSCVKVFNTTTTPSQGYDYASGGYHMGYGLRNEVGLAFDADGML